MADLAPASGAAVSGAAGSTLTTPRGQQSRCCRSDNETRRRPRVRRHWISPRVEEPLRRSTYVAAFRSVAARARPLQHGACISRRANTILIAQGTELLGRYDSDARTTGVVPLDNCQGHRPPSFGPGTVTPSQLSARPWVRPELF